MANVTHRKKYKRRGTYKLQQGGAWFERKANPAEIAAHDNLGADVNIGVLLSINSLKSDNPAYKGTPYVVIIPAHLNHSEPKVKRYAYGVSAADAIKAAQNKRFTTRGFEDTDTYTGVALSAKRLLSPDPVQQTKPYVLDLGPGDVRHGSSPAEVTHTTFTQKVKRGYAQVKTGVRRDLGVARDIVRSGPRAKIFRRTPAPAPAPAAPNPAAGTGLNPPRPPLTAEQQAMIQRQINAGVV